MQDESARQPHRMRVLRVRRPRDVSRTLPRRVVTFADVCAVWHVKLRDSPAPSWLVPHCHHRGRPSDFLVLALPTNVAVPVDDGCDIYSRSWLRECEKLANAKAKIKRNVICSLESEEDGRHIAAGKFAFFDITRDITVEISCFTVKLIGILIKMLS